jgi:3-phenylpropionate/trans-cinnamate dioxygenase ferredoxin reductase subunit
MSESEMHLVVGAGLAGASAAIAMRQAGFAGRILVVGDEPEPPYDRPPLSKEVLTAAELKLPYLHPASLYAEQKIELLPGVVVEGLDLAAGRARLGDGRTMPYDRAVLATGGRARRLSVPGGDKALYLRSLDDARRLRARLGQARRVAIIGAGVIGCEVASSARARGCGVTVLEALPGAMRRVFTPEIAEFAEALHRENGVELRFGVAVAAIEEEPSGYRILCPGSPTVEADLVVAGIGIEREIEIAISSGIETDGGIVVDEFARTSAPVVFAAGDVASFWHPRYRERLRLEHWRHAMDHGAAAGRAACGELQPYAEIPWFWTDQHGVNFQTGGLPLLGERTVFRGDPASRRFTSFHLAGDRLVGATTVNDGRNMRPSLMLIRDEIPVAAELLADPARPLRDLLRGG